MCLSVYTYHGGLYCVVLRAMADFVPLSLYLSRWIILCCIESSGRLCASQSTHITVDYIVLHCSSGRLCASQSTHITVDYIVLHCSSGRPCASPVHTLTHLLDSPGLPAEGSFNYGISYVALRLQPCSVFQLCARNRVGRGLALFGTACLTEHSRLQKR